jgi:hypothetical protein
MSDSDSTVVAPLFAASEVTSEAAEGLRLFKAFAKLDSRRRSEIVQMVEHEAARLPQPAG